MILIFDMDDTLYPERDFVLEGFRNVAKFLNIQLGIDKKETFTGLTSILDSSGRGEVFDIFLTNLGCYSKHLVNDCIEVYRSVKPKLSLSPLVKDLLSTLMTRPLYLISDGDARVQQNKVDALGLDKFFKGIFLTQLYGPTHSKPSPFCFQEVAEMENVSMSDLIYIGDDPSKDFYALNLEGGITIRVLTGRCSSNSAQPGFEAQHQINNLAELPDLLRKLRFLP